MEKTVILAPHQDDEILACYQRILEDPASVWVVFVTNGDYEGAETARVRWAESTAALTRLGLPEDHMIALGYADTGMPPEESFLWRLWHGADNVLLPSRVGCHTYHPAGGQEYHRARWGGHAAYTRAAVLHDLRDVLDELRPETIYLPNEFDGHGDHAALPLFVRAALDGLDGYTPTLWRYQVHGGDDSRWPGEGSRFDKPLNLPESQWQARRSMPMPDPAGFEATLRLFASQWEDERYMLSFVKEEQLFYPAPDEA